MAPKVDDQRRDVAGNPGYSDGAPPSFDECGRPVLDGRFCAPKHRKMPINRGVIAARKSVKIVVLDAREAVEEGRADARVGLAPPN